LLLAAALFALSGGTVGAHPTNEAEIAILTKRIAAQEGNASLYVQRAALFRESKQWDRALADCDLALRLGPKSEAARLEKCRLLVESGHPAAAKDALDTIVREKGPQVAALELRSVVHEALGKRSDARNDVALAIEASPTPRPEQFVRLAALSQSDAEALSALEGGMVKLGRLASLAEQALAIERRMGNHSAALRRVETLIADQPAHIPWWRLKGEILLESGDKAGASSAGRSALKLIDDLPARRRSTPAMTQMRREIERLLAAAG
jgi:predicted Zn-dependent protease